jgi:hypothetical protein
LWIERLGSNGFEDCQYPDASRCRTRAYHTAILRETNGVVGGSHGAAAQLGVPRTTLISRMQKLGIANGTIRLRSAQSTRELSGVSEGVSSGSKKGSAERLHVMEMAAG